MLLIVMYQAQTWRLWPGETFTFGRAPACSAVLPASDRGLSRTAGSFRYHGDSWWVRNDSRSSLLYLSGDLGFRVDLPPGMEVPLQQWHIKVRLQGAQGDYTLRLRLPDLDDVTDEPGQPAGLDRDDRTIAEQAKPASATTSTQRPPRLSDDDRLVLAARFEEYLTWRHVGEPAPRSAAETAERVGWSAHMVIKRCENIRNRYINSGIPGLRGPRALEELVRLLMASGMLTADDLRRLPPTT
jgi:predicted component of type VI protein secretion system